MIKIGFKVFLCLALTFIYSSARAEASPEKAKTNKAEDPHTFMNFLFTNVHSKETLEKLIILASNNNLDAARAINNDLEKRAAGAKTFPKLELRNTKLYVDGKSSGIRISSMNPVNVEFKGAVWNYKKNISLDRNYFSLVNFLANPRSTTSGVLFFPAAAASELDPDLQVASFFNGVIAGLVGTGSGIISAAAAPGAGAATIGGAAAGLLGMAGVSFGTGFLVILAIADERQRNEGMNILEQFAGGGFDLSCTDGIVDFQMQNKQCPRIIIEKEDNGSLKLYDKKCEQILTMVTKGFPNELRAALAKCKTNSDADKYKPEIKEGLAQIYQTRKEILTPRIPDSSVTF